MMIRCHQSLTAEVAALMEFLHKPQHNGNFSNFLVIAFAVVCVVMPLDLSQLAFAVVGAVAFSILQSIQPKKRDAVPKYLRANQVSAKNSTKTAVRADKPKPTNPSNRSPPQQNGPPRPDVRKPSAAPVKAPTFQSSAWDAQVTELLHQIAPSIDDDKIVAKLAGMVKAAIKPMIPEVEVVGFASGDLTRKKAFGVAVPDVDVVANVNPLVLAERLGGRLGSFNGKLDPKKLQKSAIRACTDRLVSAGGFKFRRSAFRGAEPKVTLLAPASFGICEDSIPIDFSVNAVSPLHNAALLTECGQMDPRARELILLVKRWAKDRGICHAAKGHLSPYAWSLLCVFFLQAGMKDDESILPSLASFKKASKLARLSPVESPSQPTGSQKSTATLFADFISFYHENFDWKTEAVSLRAGRRGNPGLSLPLHIIVSEDGKTTSVGPSIEDPFDDGHNLGAGMSSPSLSRLFEELARASDICSKAVSLAELLEPWAPPEQEHESSDNRDEDKSASAAPAAAPWRARAA
jgi:hypothetical protein